MKLGWLARPLIASVFLDGGLDVLDNPAPRAERARPFIENVTAAVPELPSDPVDLVRLNAAVQVVGAAMLVVGFVPRLAALALAGSLVPTTLGGHPFWTIQDEAARKQQRTHFLKNLAILGGLLALAFD